MTPLFAALSTAEKPPERMDFSTDPVVDSRGPRLFFSADLRRDFAARLRSLRFSACRLCFSAERVFAMNCSYFPRFDLSSFAHAQNDIEVYRVSTPSFFSSSRAFVASGDF